MRKASSWVLIGAVAAAVCALGASAGNGGGPAFKVAGTWGTNGSANGQFLGAYGITADAAGLVYVADRDNDRLQVFTAKGGFVRKWGSQGEGTGQFVNPQDVAIGPDGSVWAADLKNGRVQQFSKDGGFETELGTPKQALGVAVDADGNVYASTAGDNIHVVVRFDKTPTGYSGAKTFTGAVEAPGDVEASPDGSIYVTDERTHVVKRFDGAGKLLKTIKAGPSSPAGIGVDLDCNLWVTNISQRRLDRFSPSGKLLGTASSPDLIGQDVAVGPKGDLYAVHTNPSSVVRFQEARRSRRRRGCRDDRRREGRHGEGEVRAARRGLPGAGRRRRDAQGQGRLRQGIREGRGRQDDHDHDAGEGAQGQDNGGDVHHRPQDERASDDADEERQSEGVS